MSLIRPRPLVRWHGGKWAVAPWIIQHLPRHRVYTEPFGGGASVLLRKPRAYGEVYNDLDGEVVNLFKVARDHGARLRRAVRLTPFARSEYRGSDRAARSPLERARRTLVRSFMGFGNLSPAKRPVGFLASVARAGNAPVHDWQNLADAMDFAIKRLQGVVIECRPARDLMREHDSPATVHYCDPPYLPETRDKGPDYRHEMTRADHERLHADLSSLRGGVVLSGYRSALYDRLYRRWKRVERMTYANGALPRTEVLWIKPSGR